jgi:nitrate/nitrite transporter NarK
MPKICLAADNYTLSRYRARRLWFDAGDFTNSRFGWLSDRIGRKPVIYLGLILFASAVFIAAFAADIYWVNIGRIIQGAGAISAAVMALAADLDPRRASHQGDGYDWHDHRYWCLPFR